MNEPETNALRLLRSAYEKDEPVHVGGSTRLRADGTWSVHRQVADRLYDAGLARPSRPSGRFALLTEKGKR